QSIESDYIPAEPEGFEHIALGADLFLDQDLIQQVFPYLSNDTVAVLHVRNAGWLSAQQFGAYLLEQVKNSGGNFLSGKVVEILQKDGQVVGVKLANGERIEGNIFINAAGPMLKDLGDLIGVDIPVYNELHLKASINDSLIAVDRDAPMVILAENQILPWTDEEKEMLKEEEETKYLTDTLPSGAHLRPEGGMEASSLLLLWDVHDEKVEAVFPPELDPMYPELALRGISTLVPGLKKYIEKMPKPFIDGGYYTKTQENRPLACPLELKGAYVIGAMAGYGIMAAAGLAEIVAAHVAESELPEYAPAFSLSRYQDENYINLLEDWGDSWQL
ncbi:MAG: FAD-binding oxidoreductase, partial [Chloroflexi bacterium]|nr:FAD-binding oxidoreductase [Chloroflexota bacterium]